MVGVRRFLVTLLVTVVTGLGVLVAPGTATAAVGDLGFQGRSFAGVTNNPTSDKAQSKLWYAQGSWWAVMFEARSLTWHIFRLDRSTQQWTDTGVQVDDRRNTLSDVLWDGTHLYVASHVATVSSDSSPIASKPASPARLYRYSWSASRGYTLDSGFPATITTNSSESMTLAKDSTGTLWATWTEVRMSNGVYTSTVYANSSTAGREDRWGSPFALPVAGATVSPDDISSVVSFGTNKIGIIWSNQTDGSVYWAVHNDGAAPNTWRGGPALRGNKAADDHVNIKSVQSDETGRVFAVVKTSLDTAGDAVASDPQIRLLSFMPRTGAWTSTTVGTIADCHTRPLLMLDEANETVHVFATAPTSSGCPYSGASGTIYDKTAPMDAPVFAPGRGTPVIRDVASATMNDVTSTKQSVTAESGIVVLASNTGTQRYWHADLSATAPAPAAPAASFTASAATGEAPLPVQFTDTSSGEPSSWAWDFGDGATATVQNPTHTYTAPGTYTVTLTATNATGSSAEATATITVAAEAAPASPITSGGASTAAATTPTTEVVIPRPDGVESGDLLIAQVTSDGAATMASVPAGWTATLTKPLNLAGNAQVTVYSRVVVDAATEPAGYTWQLSGAQKWGAGMTAFSGVDPASPFDSEPSTKVDTSYTATTLTVPGVTTVTEGALLIGGIGLDNMTVGVNPPGGWTESWESTGAQVSELARQNSGVTGATGDVTWTLSKAAAAAGWIRALRPAPDSAPVPVVPAVSLTASATGGQAPLPVQFAGTATGEPTAWAWDFGDGTTATTQNATHTYTAPGTYTVTLTVTNADGTSAPATSTVTVSRAAVIPTASFRTSATSGRAPLPVSFASTATGNPTAWAWDFGDGTTATTRNATHTYTAPGTHTVTLTATNGIGASAPVTFTVTVTPAPVIPTASFTTSATSGRAPLPVTFTSTATGEPTAWAWDFGDGTTATTRNATHTYTAPGTYTVTLTVTNADGTSAPVTSTVTVTAAPGQGGGSSIVSLIQRVLDLVVSILRGRW